jgi:DNA gyrase/topoisomerase IV subunit B
MPELIERGYLYIAQPPLYKIKKGKQEQYLKDDVALEIYLAQVALENAALYPSAKGAPISGVGLEDLITHYFPELCEAGEREVGGDRLERRQAWAGGCMGRAPWVHGSLRHGSTSSRKMWGMNGPDLPERRE